MIDALPWSQALLPGTDDGDWQDVLRRARRQRRRRGGFAFVALAAVALVGLASAYALGHPVVDFGRASKGPRTVVNSFGSMQVGAPPGMAPGVLPHQARRITSVRIDGKPHVLWVAPTKRGGFCFQWSRFAGGCRANRHDKWAKRLDVGGSQGAGGITVIEGSFFQSAGARLELAYADGQKAELPFVWVTAPINAGFYLYRVPDAHRSAAHRATRLTLFDGSGRVIAREPILNSRPMPFVVHRLPGFPHLTVPARADWGRRQQLFDLRADDGARIGLWIAPERGGGRCFWTNQAVFCSNVGRPVRRGARPSLQLGFEGGGKHVTLCCGVGPQVARVEARFQDGERISLYPRQGYLVWPIPSRHYPRGRRLSELLAYSNAGHVMQRQRMATDAPGLYPCAKPKAYGYGVSQCP